MGRAPCCDKASVKRGPWSPEEDEQLRRYVRAHGIGGNWIALPHKAGLKRCGKSCRLRWLNYLRPDIRHGGYTAEEDRVICSLYGSIGSRWSIIASKLPGRTDNDVKNYWNTKLKKKAVAMGMQHATGGSAFSAPHSQCALSPAASGSSSSTVDTTSSSAGGDIFFAAAMDQQPWPPQGLLTHFHAQSEPPAPVLPSPDTVALDVVSGAAGDWAHGPMDNVDVFLPELGGTGEQSLLFPYGELLFSGLLLQADQDQCKAAAVGVGGGVEHLSASTCSYFFPNSNMAEITYN
ncbi:transcription factor RAX1 [Brachypodium distachyon]|uniref:Uncharacterized protein n=1 Tax=Brachypodium distachyon TaxID=15368 RepID=I1HGP8_BRADI|nr:transcription factor RAX1 [Brachypodium distachyon]KQK05002.1 hypothetical protein BRADI_2g17280v3 [Brachypodium distachyon]|eukprot:XP_003565943.1 transcription factor RAX1 [Brachypodium distachyon]